MNNSFTTEFETRDGYIWKPQQCPICVNAPQKKIGMRGGRAHREGSGVDTAIWQCQECSLIFPDPMPVPADGLSQHYNVDADEYFANHDIGSKSELAHDLIDQAERLLGRKGKLLDVGVGRGEVLIAAQEAGWEVAGVEPSKTFADHVERRTGAKIWRQSVEEANIPHAEFDVVVLAAVLEHLYNPDEIVAKISRILKKGGYLYLDVPNEMGLVFKVGNLYQRIRGRDWCINLAPTFAPFHVFGFSPRSLRTILNKHGLEPKGWHVYGGTSLVPSRGGMIGKLESIGAALITKLSNMGEMGTYIETWATKR